MTVGDVVTFVVLIFFFLSAFRHLREMLMADDFTDHPNDLDLDDLASEPYQVRQRRIRRTCEYCGSRLSKRSVICSSCGAKNDRYEYRLVDRVRYR